jgi:hypothetical protein
MIKVSVNVGDYVQARLRPECITGILAFCGAVGINCCFKGRPYGRLW